MDDTRTIAGLQQVRLGACRYCFREVWHTLGDDKARGVMTSEGPAHKWCAEHEAKRVLNA
jgi:hypothetical protein